MNVLSIGGSDPSSGAGIQSDVRTFTSLGVHGLTVVTAITSQNTVKFSKTESVSSSMVKDQIDVIFSDFAVDAIKIGMVYKSSIIKAIYSELKNVKAPIILDPVIRSTTNGSLIEKNALNTYKKLLLPLSFVITPNVSEAEKLTKFKISTKNDALKCALKIKDLGAKNVVITGNQFKKGHVDDFVLENTTHYSISGKKLQMVNHGSGCNYSASLAVAIAAGKSLRNAVKFAKNYAYNSIKNSKKIGKGVSITNYKKSEIEKSLSNSILYFKNLRNIHSLIPECQTNFVYSKPQPKSIHDILGISGRIVRAGTSVNVAGNLEYGASRHVASTILAVTKKFPLIRSALNLKYDSKIIEKFREYGLTVLSYDRTKEPSSIKRKENSSVLWGIKSSIKKTINPPDIIFHRGDFGKEPMIVVFGKNPSEVIKKISSIL
ncbi:MAG: bifunctional hydroxymethylpyrimidine kinase/phosphomethylpyrimidine kinase [Thaumarchaeota archaeon]|nr:bifunctional hydroxymethylpyrimidine kinase/phosphomethylpyrimidine kinase [Nitrososphaerota archaeon]